MSVERLDGGYRSQLQVQGEEKLIVTLTAVNFTIEYELDRSNRHAFLLQTW